MDEVRNRTKQAVKKGKVLLFHWRGGYFTKEILAELLKLFDEEARAKEKRAYTSVNWPQAVLRVRFEDGIGTEQDRKKSFELSLKAADAGNLTGMFHTAICYEKGMGVDKDAGKKFV